MRELATGSARTVCRHNQALEVQFDRIDRKDS